MNTNTPTTTSAPIISRSGRQEKYGSRNDKRVRGLTPDETAAAREGQKVYFRATCLSKGKTGTNWRFTLACNGRIYPRVPSPEEVAVLREQTGLN